MKLSKLCRLGPSICTDTHYACTHVHTHTHAQTHRHTRTHLHTHTHTHTHIHTRTHTNTLTLRHTRTHTLTLTHSLSHKTPIFRGSKRGVQKGVQMTLLEGSKRGGPCYAYTLHVQQLQSTCFLYRGHFESFIFFYVKF